jgi:hypothetical protein
VAKNWFGKRNPQGLGNVIPFPPAIGPRLSAASADPKAAPEDSSAPTPAEVRNNVPAHDRYTTSAA